MSYSGGLQGVRHVMLLVNTKLLTTYGRLAIVWFCWLVMINSSLGVPISRTKDTFCSSWWALHMLCWTWIQLSCLAHRVIELSLRNRMYLFLKLDISLRLKLKQCECATIKFSNDILYVAHNYGCDFCLSLMHYLCDPRSPRLETADILLIILLVYHHFHSRDEGICIYHNSGVFQYYSW